MNYFWLQTNFQFCFFLCIEMCKNWCLPFLFYSFMTRTTKKKNFPNLKHIKKANVASRGRVDLHHTRGFKRKAHGLNVLPLKQIVEPHFIWVLPD